MMWIVRKFGWAQTIVFALIALVSGWSLWLPYFVPIITIEGHNLKRVGDDLVVDAYSFKNLPCSYEAGAGMLHLANNIDMPVRITNFYTGATLGKGLLMGSLPEDTYTKVPLWFQVETRLILTIPEEVRHLPVEEMQFQLIFNYRCNILNEHQIVLRFPAKGTSNGS